MLISFRIISILLVLSLIPLTTQPVSAAVDKVWLFVNEEVEVELETIPKDQNTVAQWYTGSPPGSGFDNLEYTEKNADHTYRFKATDRHAGKDLAIKGVIQQGTSLGISTSAVVARLIVFPETNGNSTLTLSSNATLVSGDTYRVDIYEGEDSVVKLLPAIDGVAAGWANLHSMTAPEGLSQGERLNYTAPAYDVSAGATNIESTKVLVYGDPNHPDVPNIGDEITVEYHILPEMKTLDFTLELITSPASGGAAEAQVVVKNANGVALEGVSIDWALSTGTIYSSDAQTDSSGQGRIVFIAPVGTMTLTATVNGKSKSIDVVFGDNNFVISSIQVNKLQAIADGEDSIEATITLTNNGAPVSDVAVVWQTSGSANLSGNLSNTNVNGEATISLTNTVAEYVTITALVGTTQTTKTVQFTGDPNTATLEAGSLTFTGSPALADGSSTVTASVRVIDANNNLVPGKTVNWTNTGSAVLSGATSITDTDGRATITLTNTEQESVTVTASLSGDSESGTCEFIVASVHRVTATNPKMHFDVRSGNTSTEVTAKVVDNAGNPVPNITVYWFQHATPYSSTDRSFGNTLLSGYGKISAQQSVTNSNGEATVTFSVWDRFVSVLLFASLDGKMPTGQTGRNSAFLTAQRPQPVFPSNISGDKVGVLQHDPFLAGTTLPMRYEIKINSIWDTYDWSRFVKPNPFVVGPGGQTPTTAKYISAYRRSNKRLAFNVPVEWPSGKTGFYTLYTRYFK